LHADSINVKYVVNCQNFIIQNVRALLEAGCSANTCHYERTEDLRKMQRNNTRI